MMKMSKLLALLMAIAMLFSLGSVALADAEAEDGVMTITAADVEDEAAPEETAEEEPIAEVPTVGAVDEEPAGESSGEPSDEPAAEPSDEPALLSITSVSLAGVEKKPAMGEAFSGPYTSVSRLNLGQGDATAAQVVEEYWVNDEDGSRVDIAGGTFEIGTYTFYAVVEAVAEKGAFADTVRAYAVGVYTAKPSTLEGGKLVVALASAEVRDPAYTYEFTAANAAAPVYEEGFAGPYTTVTGLENYEVELVDEYWVKADDESKVTADNGAVFEEGSYTLYAVVAPSEKPFADTVSVTIGRAAQTCEPNEDGNVEIMVGSATVENPACIYRLSLSAATPAVDSTWSGPYTSEASGEPSVAILEEYWVKTDDETVIDENSSETFEYAAYELYALIEPVEGKFFADSFTVNNTPYTPEGPNEPIEVKVASVTIAPDTFDLIVNAPAIGGGASRISAIGGGASTLVIDFYWTDADGNKITLEEGTFEEGEYTLTIFIRPAEGKVVSDPIRVKTVAGIDTDYVDLPVIDNDEDGTPVYKLEFSVTLPIESASDEPSGEPESTELKVTIAPDGSSAKVANLRDGLYVRVALLLDKSGETGLFVTQCGVEEDGSVILPVFNVPGLQVKGICVAVVDNLEDICAPAFTPVDDTVDMIFM